MGTCNAVQRGWDHSRRGRDGSVAGSRRRATWRGTWTRAGSDGGRPALGGTRPEGEGAANVENGDPFSDDACGDDACGDNACGDNACGDNGYNLDARNYDAHNRDEYNCDEYNCGGPDDVKWLGGHNRIPRAGENADPFGAHDEIKRGPSRPSARRRQPI